MKKRNYEVLGNVEKQKKLLLDELRDLIVIVEERTLSDIEKSRKAEIISSFKRTTLMDEVGWRPKLRALWLRAGDKSTKFFHCVANLTRKDNIVDSLGVNGPASLDATKISEHIVRFYTRLYSRTIYLAT